MSSGQAIHHRVVQSARLSARPSAKSSGDAWLRWTIGALAVALSAAVVETLAAFRATAEERRRVMPGDRFVSGPMYSTTHAVTIDVPPERVWPWLAQMGADRAGWYSYDRIDNGGRASAGDILAEYQHVSPGDVFPAIPGATDAFVVAAAEPPRDLVLTVPIAGGGTLTSWEFLLDPLERGRTRLIVRARVSPQWRAMAASAPTAAQGHPIFIQRAFGVLGKLPAPLLMVAGGFGHRVMQNQQLRGLKRRAEA